MKICVRFGFYVLDICIASVGTGIYVFGFLFGFIKSCLDLCFDKICCIFETLTLTVVFVVFVWILNFLKTLTVFMLSSY